MSEENKNPNSDNEDPDKKDPYDFFKLAGPENNDDDKKKKNGGKKRIPFWSILLLIFAGLAIADFFFIGKNDNLVNFSDFKAKIESGQIVRVELGDTYFYGYGPEELTLSENAQKGKILFNVVPTSASRVYKTVGVLMPSFIELLDEKGVEYKFVAKSNNYLIQLILNLLIPFGIIFLMYFLVFRKIGNGTGGMGSFFGSGSGRTKAVEEGKVKTRFQDVAGVDEAKEELVEVVDFLKSPKKYTDIGGKIPKGVLLVGPPGTGKTLLARAVAGEAGVPFFRISGSDFVEMFVGVGASRVRDLFRQAREKAPCIIFIDELDAIGKSRVNNLGGNDEREQTLNQLLVEMDGFDNEKGLIILAATNRADILDPALLRPGRFDRQVPVERPDVKGREAILKIHAKNVKIDSDVDFNSIAHGTSGFAGADLANVVNEAALLAVRNGRKTVSMLDFNEAIDKVSIGLKKKNRRENERERKIIAYHETGHALVGAFTEGHTPVHKITVIPRSHGIGGFTQYREEEEKSLLTRTDLINEVDVSLGGRAAEEIIFGEVSTGASNDISQATDILKRMITDYGMSDRFKNMTLGKGVRGYSGGEPELIREFSEETQKYVDDEIARIMNERYEHVLELLKEHKELLEYISNRLMEIETMEGKEFYDIVKGEAHCRELEKAASQSQEVVVESSSGESSESAPESAPAESDSTKSEDASSDSDALEK
ncbi:MAG: ATP-dependent zinc metalloprotease FtsH [Treponema sp.]|nr:ATP-dependent zinc metalloprotease FtsH [Treponema sp.]